MTAPSNSETLQSNPANSAPSESALPTGATQPGSLRDRLHPTIQAVAGVLETAWQTYLTDLEPYAMPPDLGYVEGIVEGEVLVIENRCYQTREFRKIHLELARMGNSLDILHCVMFPRSTFDLPMFGADLVAGRGNLGMAIADLSPLGEALPSAIDQALSQLPELAFSQKRTLPTWADIFSPYCVFIRPSVPEDEQLFTERVRNFLAIHCQQATAAEPVTGDRPAALLAAQQRYCHQQLQNDKTRRVLEKGFGVEWADRYMNEVLFDVF